MKMTKLKTLKNLERLHANPRFICEEELKAEAVKWVKGNGQYTEIDNINFSKCPKCRGKLEYTYEKTYDCEKCDTIWDVWQLFLIHIFNLKEEDLEEKNE